MKPLQSHTKLIQIQTRLSKQSYLSRGNLPGSADAKMFLFLESLKRYPDRKAYPNFYHWYILMKQFAHSSMEKWISNNEYQDDDPLITEFISIKSNERILSDSINVKKQKNIDNTVDEHAKLVRSQEYTSVNINEIEYIMDVKIKEENQYNMRELVTNFLQQEEVQLQDLQVITEERRVRIVTKMDAKKYQELKNKISHLEGVETFESKKKDKKFQTVNSLSNFFGDSRE